MTEASKRSPKRKFPIFYEKIVPVILVVFAIIVVGVVIFAAGIAIGLFPGL